MENIDSLFIKKVKQSLIESYKTPKVQIEREVQLILSIFIESVINREFNIQNSSNRIKLICREFPLETKANNQSKNIDYLMADKENIYFVELKTSSKSFEEDQLNHYLEIKGRKSYNKLFEHLQYIIDLYDYEKKRNLENRKILNKYRFLCDKVEKGLESCNLEAIGFDHFIDLKIVYVIPSGLEKDIRNKYLHKDVKLITLKKISEHKMDYQNNDGAEIVVWNSFRDIFKHLDELDEEY